MSYRYLFPTLGLVLVALGLARQGWFWLAAWLGGNFLVLGLAHARGWHRVFGKRDDGTLPWWSGLLFFPMFLYSAALWHLLRLVSREAACNTVSETLVIGRRVLASEVESRFDNFVDLTAEFSEPAAIRRSTGYRCFPILDGAAPSPEALHAALTGLRPGRTYVHCAQGHGRTALFALAILLHSGAAQNVEEGLRLLSAARPAIRLSREQRQCIQAYARLVRPS